MKASSLSNTEVAMGFYALGFVLLSEGIDPSLGHCPCSLIQSRPEGEPSQLVLMMGHDGEPIFLASSKITSL